MAEMTPKTFGPQMWCKSSVYSNNDEYHRKTSDLEVNTYTVILSLDRYGVFSKIRDSNPPKFESETPSFRRKIS